VVAYFWGLVRTATFDSARANSPPVCGDRHGLT
jgi:hypothetical protein